MKYVVCFEFEGLFYFAWDRPRYIEYTRLKLPDAKMICKDKSQALYDLEEAEDIKRRLTKYFKKTKPYKNTRPFLIRQLKFQGTYRKIC